ncbi:hypothetical protein ACFWGN_00310 [Oerskovia sp. NPDC060338]|uniref:hypothetical protein n=1 Tax=Oerskovia sp. NPDC060338 TaxID=3347100 RepID=UPI00364AA0FB
MGRGTSGEGAVERRTRADKVAIDLVEAATKGHLEFMISWNQVLPRDRPAVVDALSTRVAVDALVNGFAGAPTSLRSQDLGAQAARAAFQLASSLVAAAIRREDPHLVAARLRELRAAARSAPEIHRYAWQMTCEPEARQVGAAVAAAARDGRDDDATYLVRTTSDDLVEAVLHVTIDLLANLMVRAGLEVESGSASPALRAEMSMLRPDLWPEGGGTRTARREDVLVVAALFAGASRRAPREADAVLRRVRRAALRDVR